MASTITNLSLTNVNEINDAVKTIKKRGKGKQMKFYAAYDAYDEAY
jgi:hypothetical protein